MIYLVLLLMLLFVGYIIFNMYVAHKELITYHTSLIEVCTEDNRETNSYEKLANWHKDQISRFSNDTVYVFAGEFNYEFYETLLTEALADILSKNNLKIVAIGGPHISVDPITRHNKVIEWAKEGLIELYIREDKRIIGHGIVSAKSDDLCLVEDPHGEFNERAVSLFENSPDFCGKLRIKARRLKNISRKIDDFSKESINSFTRTRTEIIENEVDYKDDSRIDNESYLNKNSNPLQERIRLKWLAQII